MPDIQAEQERKRILQRLKEGREAQSKPHQPRWFTFHPEVTGLTMCKHPLVSLLSILMQGSMHVS